jgi:hypothetical protein
MNITKEQIREWLSSHGYKIHENTYLPTNEIVYAISGCINDLAPKWVSVYDRLPDNTKAVLVCIVSTQGPSFFEIDHYVNGEFHFQALSKCNKVTHWMPLPEPPK